MYAVWVCSFCPRLSLPHILLSSLPIRCPAGGPPIWTLSCSRFQTVKVKFFLPVRLWASVKCPETRFTSLYKQSWTNFLILLPNFESIDSEVLHNNSEIRFLLLRVDKVSLPLRHTNCPLKHFLSQRSNSSKAQQQTATCSHRCQQTDSLSTFHPAIQWPELTFIW